MKSLEISPDEFRRLAEKVTQLTADYLRELDSRPIFPSTTGEESERLFHTPLDEKGMGAEALEGLQDVIKHSRAQNARFFGYVLGSGEPVAAVADLVASVLNQNVTAWRSGPAAVTIERTVVGWLAQAIGCPGFRGSLTGGGSSANLMALAMAREAKLPANEAGMRAASARRGLRFGRSSHVDSEERRAPRNRQEKSQTHSNRPRLPHDPGRTRAGHRARQKRRE